MALLLAGVGASSATYGQERRADTERSDSLSVEGVVAQVLDAYPSLEAVRRHVDAATARAQQDQIKQLERTLRVVQQQHTAGTATAFAVQSTKTRLSAARSQLSQFRNQRQRQVAELRQLLGRRLGGALSLQWTIDPRLTLSDTSRIRPDTLADRALLAHPAVQVAKAQARAARRQVRVVDRSDTPTPSLDARGGVKNGYPSDLNELRLNESIGVSLTVPLFEGFARQRKVDEAQAQLQAACRFTSKRGFDTIRRWNRPISSSRDSWRSF